MTDLAIDCDGVRLAASVYGPDAGPPVVLLHGLAHARDTWEELAAALAVHHRVWTLDFRGHGDSARAERYGVPDFLDDARGLLARLDRPAVLVGHSLGAVVAAILAQEGHPRVRAAFLEEPPWFLGDPIAWNATAFPRTFAAIEAAQAHWQRADAPLATYVDFLANVPSPLGGVTADHVSARHIVSQASALQRQDNLAWRDAGPRPHGLAAIDAARPFRRRVKVVAGEPRLGSALRTDDAVRMASLHADVEIVRYDGCGHDLHRVRSTEARFAADVGAFIGESLHA